MPVIAYDIYWDEAFAKEHGVTRCATMDEVLRQADVISLHCFLSDETRGMHQPGDHRQHEGRRRGAELRPG